MQLFILKNLFSSRLDKYLMLVVINKKLYIYLYREILYSVLFLSEIDLSIQICYRIKTIFSIILLIIMYLSIFL